MRRSCLVRWSTRSRPLPQPWTQAPPTQVAVTCSPWRACRLRQTCSCPPPTEPPGRCQCTARDRRPLRPAGTERHAKPARCVIRAGEGGTAVYLSVLRIASMFIHLPRYRCRAEQPTRLTALPAPVLGHHHESIPVLRGVPGNANEKKICASVVLGHSHSMRFRPCWPSILEVFTVGDVE